MTALELGLVPWLAYYLGIYVFYIWFLSGALGLLFYLLDLQGLRRISTLAYAESWKIWGFFLTPVNLFLRASKIDRHYGYFAAYMAIIVINGLVVLIGASI